ncbi:GNAT family N-acetyltransferase [Verrucomicrobiaceae bacterium 227]
MQKEEWREVAELIFRSTNVWYEKNLNRGCFPGSDRSVCELFPEVYEALDPGCCLVVEIEGVIAASCFYHPRERHVSLGIMNVSPDFGGRGLAGILLDEIVKRAGGKPVRLVSSAMNLDSYSLYTKAGFRPVALYQDMYFPAGKTLSVGPERVRKAEVADLGKMVALEEELVGIRRGGDFRHFLENQAGIWSGWVTEREGDVTGFLFAVNHPGSRMLGPGVMRDAEDALALISRGLTFFEEGESPVFLVPAAEGELVSALYEAGARNCELHVAQVLGAADEIKGIVLPTFMPETG